MIHHVTREVPPALLEDCVRFYGVLGFEPVLVPPTLADRAVWLEQPHTRQQVHLVPLDGAGPQTGHFALVCGDYDRTVQELREARYELEPRAEHWGSPRAYARDPAGNVVELMAWAPGESRE